LLLATPVLTGGDHFLMFRFYQPAYPVMTLTLTLLLIAWSPAGASAQLASLLQPKRNLIPFCCLSFLLAYCAYHFLQQPSWNSFRSASPLQYQFSVTESGIRTGERLGRLFAGADALPTIGVYKAGGVARTYRGRIVDLLGLNTPAIAHYRGDRKGRKNHAAFEKEAFFKLGRIDVLLASPPIPPDTVNFASYVLKGLMDDPRFVQEWRFGLLRSSRAEGDTIEAFYSAGLIEGLEATAQYQFLETRKWSGKWVAVDSTAGAGTNY